MIHTVLSQIYVCRALNPRRGVTPDVQARLTADIKERGLLVPLGVANTIDFRGWMEVPSEFRYVLVFGFRRAAALLEIDGPDAETTADIMPTFGPDDLSDLAVTENTLREDLHPLDLGDAALRLKRRGVPLSRIGAELGTGWCEQHAFKYARLAESLSPIICKAWLNGHPALSFNAADDLARLELREQERIWDKYLATGGVN